MSAGTSFNDRPSTSIDVLKKLGTAGKGAALSCVSCGRKTGGAIISTAAAAAKFAATGLAFRRTDKPWYRATYVAKFLKNILGLTSSTLKCSAMFIPRLDPCSKALPYLSRAILVCDAVEICPTLKELVKEHKFADIVKALAFGFLTPVVTLGIEAMCGTEMPLIELSMFLSAFEANICKKYLDEHKVGDLSDLATDVRLEFVSKLRICEKLGLGTSEPQTQGEKLFLQCLGMFMTKDALLGAWQSFFGKKSSDTSVGHKTETASAETASAETASAETEKPTIKKRRKKKKKSQTSQPSPQQKQPARTQETPARAKTQKP